MKKSYLVIAGILVLVLVVVFSYSGTYNEAVGLQEGTDEAWSNIQTTYQRRADLIPNLVAVTEKASDSEKEIFTELTRARSGLPSKEEVADLKTKIADAKTPAQLQQLESILMVVFSSKKIVYGVSIVLNIFFKNGAALSNGSIVSSLNTERT